MTLKELNQAVNALVSKAAADSGTSAELVEEDLSRPIPRPGVKVVLEPGSDTRMTDGSVERSATFRIYFFARDKNRPKMDNLAMREALGAAFLDGISVGDGWLPIDEGLSFDVVDGVLTAALDINWTEEIPETGEYMEELNLEMEGTL